MNNRIAYPTALSGRLFLCPEIAVYHARPPPIAPGSQRKPITIRRTAYVLPHLPALRGELRPGRTL